MLSERDKGKLPSQPEPNPRHSNFKSTNSVEHVQAIGTLRSGRIINPELGESSHSEESSTPLVGNPNDDLPSPPIVSIPDDSPPSPKVGSTDNIPSNIGNPDLSSLPNHGDNLEPSKESDQSKLDAEPPLRVYKPKAPFPSRLLPNRQSDQVEKAIEILKQVKVNIPLLDAIKQMPSYAKCLKDLCTRKRTTQVPKKAFLAAQVSSILTSQTPVKYKDPGCPTISIGIGECIVENALLDLGASVNLLPYSVYCQLELGEMKPTRITLQLADRSVKFPRGIVEDVLIKVGDFVFPVDFIVLDTQPVINPRDQIPVILGRPFLATSNALINCRNGLMKITFGNMTAELNIFNILPHEQSGRDSSVNMIQAIVNTEHELNDNDTPEHESFTENFETESHIDLWGPQVETFELFDDECNLDIQGINTPNSFDLNEPQFENFDLIEFVCDSSLDAPEYERFDDDIELKLPPESPELKNSDDILKTCLDHVGKGFDEDEYFNHVSSLLESSNQYIYERVVSLHEQMKPPPDPPPDIDHCLARMGHERLTLDLTSVNWEDVWVLAKIILESNKATDISLFRTDLRTTPSLFIIKESFTLDLDIVKIVSPQDAVEIFDPGGEQSTDS